MRQGSAVLTVVGMGPGGEGFITPLALEAISSSDTVFGSGKWRPVVERLGRDLRDYLPIECTLRFLSERHGFEDIAVVVSGDPGLFSLYGVIKRALPDIPCGVVPAVSSPQAFFAKLGLEWQDVDIVSFHAADSEGRGTAIPKLAKVSGKVCILCGPGRFPADICGDLAAKGARGTAAIGENITLDNERIEITTVSELGKPRARRTYSSLCLLYLEIDND